MRIDLHTHSSVSDGTDSPAQLLTAAVDGDLDVICPGKSGLFLLENLTKGRR